MKHSSSNKFRSCGVVLALLQIPMISETRHIAADKTVSAIFKWLYTQTNNVIVS